MDEHYQLPQLAIIDYSSNLIVRVTFSKEELDSIIFALKQELIAIQNTKILTELDPLNYQIGNIEAMTPIYSIIQKFIDNGLMDNDDIE